MTDAASEPDNNSDREEDREEFKCYIGRVPTTFTEEIVQRILVTTLGGDETDSKSPIVEKVELIYPHDDDDDDGNGVNNDNDNGKSSNYNRHNNNSGGYRADRMNRNPNSNRHEEKAEDNPNKEHRGFGFVSFATAEYRDSALKLGTIKGKRKVTSKKAHKMYLRPYVAKTYDDDGSGDSQENNGEKTASNTTTTTNGRDICYLWNSKRCPYGENCKFRHVGDGGCVQQEKDLSPEEQKRLQRKRKGKCFTYKKKGTCPKGEDCPFSHDFQSENAKDITTATTSSSTDDDDNDNTKNKNVCVVASTVVVLPSSEKDCINWKTKGKCRKGAKCVYKHDPVLQRRALDKIAKKKRLRDGDNDDNCSAKRSCRKEKQPLSVRVFGMNYDTTEADVKEFIESASGHPIKSILFPRFPDSHRSKGYCGVYFASPKAARAAVEKCDNAELHGRWLRVQTGKSMTVDEWEGLHRN